MPSYSTVLEFSRPCFTHLLLDLSIDALWNTGVEYHLSSLTAARQAGLHQLADVIRRNTQRVETNVRVPSSMYGISSSEESY